MMHDIYLALSELKLVYRSHGKLVALTPKTLYQQFIEFSPLLPPNTTAWSFSLVTLFYNALSVELQEAIRLAGYTLPNNTTLSTLSSQICALQILRENLLLRKNYCAKKNSGFSSFYILFRLAMRELTQCIRKPSQPFVLILTLVNNLDRHDLS